MAMAYDTSPSDYDYVIAQVNLFFTAVFIFEACCKLIGYGPTGYFYSAWNKFDFFVVCTSILDLLMSYLGASALTFLKVGPQIARVFRVLRVSRLLRLVKSFQGLQKLIKVALMAIPFLFNVASILFLVYFIFAVLGVFLYGSLS